ncbi:hypothetical protein JCM4814A_01640 [Streptomyces phaeofaciens JCM 4814]|uniref:Uncharacterized protein n=1 Tax=Streptomyces phaeofaciens TaxID=68254 RepID=A0A918HRV7_9ACTN|nr:hypothetical protein [Streptomyces phaeofaciens]GGT94596.1 hypothetical protein GCM10010226_85470 [Streptomyces phaeofaciens]
MLVRSDDLVVDLAGRDAQLRPVLQDLRVGRWGSLQSLLDATGQDWWLWTSRSQIVPLGQGAPGAVKAWLDTEPSDPGACVMWCRVLTHQAVRVWQDGKGELVQQVREAARRACFTAAYASPSSPVPWLSLLDLAKVSSTFEDLDPYQQLRNTWAYNPPDRTFQLDPAPWMLWHHVRYLDPSNREVNQRMREYIEASWRSGATDFTRWAASRATAGSADFVLPLYAFVSDYQRQVHAGRRTATLYWSTEQIKHHARQARDMWFWATPARERSRLSLLDLNHLAFMLAASGEGGADAVFDEIGPHATPAPWAQVAAVLGRHSWQAEFLRARRGCRPRSHRRS